MSVENDRTRNHSGYLVFREAAGVDELRRLLALRYREYRRAGLKGLVPENEYGIDFDSYDLRARHLGLFQVGPNGERAVGYLRVVEDRELSTGSDVCRLLEQVPGLHNMTERKSPHPFPLMDYVPNIDILTELYEGIRSRGEHLVELSRFALHTRFRSLKLARHMVESAIAILAFCHHVEHAVWCCDSPCKKFYGLYGFRPVAGIQDGDFLGTGTKSSCLLGSVTSIPAFTIPRLVGMAWAYVATGRICFFWENPGSFVSHGAINLSVPHRAVAVCAHGNHHGDVKRAAEKIAQSAFTYT
jgi:hypothetical protein